MNKTKFRNTKQWKEFRLKLKRERKIDYITQKPLRKGFNCHHKDMNPANYENLNPENFEVLNKNTHKIVHEIFRYKDWRGYFKTIKKSFRGYGKIKQLIYYGTDT